MSISTRGVNKAASSIAWIVMSPSVAPSASSCAPDWSVMWWPSSKMEPAVPASKLVDTVTSLSIVMVLALTCSAWPLRNRFPWITTSSIPSRFLLRLPASMVKSALKSPNASKCTDSVVPGALKPVLMVSDPVGSSIVMLFVPIRVLSTIVILPSSGRKTRSSLATKGSASKTKSTTLASPVTASLLAL